VSARSAIPTSIVGLLASSLVEGSLHYVTDIQGNVSNQAKHFDKINDFPYISVTPGTEQREYLPSNQTWAELNIQIRIYVQNNDDPQAELEAIISDVETFIDKNQRIMYNVTTPTGIETRETVDLSIISIATDEGLLAPYGVAELVIITRYEKIRQV
jgi:hypothetical protein